ncbi:hypothetical protein AB0B50_28135 [Streptomyces sp. NPDC041068]|uniref:hypothetical protein n=1 Tax=Streptomyces sp. NPDC041068 TaxID=3155130 RepID=UPI0033C24BE4
MPDTRDTCGRMGRYEALRAKAELGNLGGSDGAALAYAQEVRADEAVADRLSATTTLWLPVYGLGVAVLVGTAAWFRDRFQSRSQSRSRSQSQSQSQSRDRAGVRPLGR